jgi:hypothetical protein
MVNAISEQATIPMLAQACKTAVYMLNRTVKHQLTGNPQLKCGMVM